MIFVNRISKSSLFRIMRGFFLYIPFLTIDPDIFILAIQMYGINKIHILLYKEVIYEKRINRNTKKHFGLSY